MPRRLLALALPALLLLAAATPAAADVRVARVVVKVHGGAATALQVGDVVLPVSDDTFLVDARRAPSSVPGVVWSAPDTTYRSTAVPNDSCWLTCTSSVDGQLELRSIGAPAAWDVTKGSSSITVAVLDNPADGTHPDLAGKVTVGPTYVADGCDLPTPRAASHGTAVAGIVGASTGNGTGVASLGWSTRVLSVGVLDGCGQGTAAGIAAGIRHATDSGARVINLSLAGDPHPVLAEAVAYAQGRGALVVAAAGNHGTSEAVWPASYPGVVAVASTDRAARRLSTFSGRGSWVDVAVPGEDVLSTATVSDGYARFTGTSFAAPMVSAAAALVLANHPHFTADDVAFRLQRSTLRPLAGAAWGVLDVARAVTDRPGGFVLAGADGGVYAFGDAEFRGSLGGQRLAQPVVATATSGASGYWLAGRDGGVFAFGGAPFLGSMGDTRLNQPVLGMAATPSGRGYWLVASDGGIFSFGDAAFAGSTGGIRLVSPISGMAMRTRTSYWLVARDGGVFAFGGAPFLGSAAGAADTPVVGIAAGPLKAGYWLATAGGRIFPYGEVVDDGAVRPTPRSPVIGIGSTAV